MKNHRENKLRLQRANTVLVSVILLGGNTAWACTCISGFRRNILSPSSGLKTGRFSEILESTYKSTQCYNPEDQHQHLHCCENLKSQTAFLFALVSHTLQHYNIVYTKQETCFCQILSLPALSACTTLYSVCDTNTEYINFPCH
jgi:hypothetical protein